ncbi:MAG: hypothetical protein E6J27_04250 [Chloroflexi bacterium]|nr:MAG: hypothetical protein E6J27_04250 [Chloroflexota bacterium]
MPAGDDLDVRVRCRLAHERCRPCGVDEGVVFREKHRDGSTPVTQSRDAVAPQQIARKLAPGAHVGAQQIRLVVCELRRFDLGGVREKKTMRRREQRAATQRTEEPADGRR